MEVAGGVVAARKFAGVAAEDMTAQQEKLLRCEEGGGEGALLGSPFVCLRSHCRENCRQPAGLHVFGGPRGRSIAQRRAVCD